MINPVTKSTRFSRLGWRSLILALVLAGVCVAGFEREIMLRSLGRWLNVAGRLERPVDAIMILGGGAATRPFVAIEMFKSGIARKILFVQVKETDENLDGLYPSEQEITRQILLHSGITADAILLLPTQVDSTEAESRVAAEYLRAHPHERLAIVTSDFHTRRARIMFSRACGPDAANLVFIGAPTDGYSACDWWHNERGMVAYLTEYLKLARTLVQ
jgi:uncharacterized SAM-binding protein YcdF (DUF218 family)